MAYSMAINIGLQVILVQFITYKERQHFFFMQREITKDIPRDVDEGEEIETIKMLD